MERIATINQRKTPKVVESEEKSIAIVKVKSLKVTLRAVRIQEALKEESY